MWRCANDYFGYCDGEPEWGKEPEPTGVGEYSGKGACKLNRETCGRYSTVSQQLEGVEVPEGNYRHETATTTTKAKSKKSKSKKGGRK